VPTELQQRFLLASRRAAAKRQRIVLGSVLVALAVSVALGVAALLQRNAARSATRAATSVALASAAIDRVETKPDEALLLALEANSSSPSAQARNAAVTALQEARELGVEAFLHGDAEVRSVDFAPDGGTLAVGSADGSVRLWDVPAAGEPVELRGPGSPPVVSVEFTRDGRTVAAGSAHGVIRLWDVESRRPVRGNLDVNRPIRAAAISPNGESVAVIDTRGRVWLWNVSGGEPRRLPGVRGEKAMLLFSPDGETLAVGATDLANVEEGTPGAAGLVDVESGEILGRMPDQNSIMALAFSPDGKTLATGGYWTAGKYPTGDDPYGEVRLWSVPKLEPAGSVTSQDFVHSVAFAPDGRTVAAGRGDGAIQLATPKEGKWIGSPHRAVRSAVTTLGLSGDGHIVAAAAADDTTVGVWDLRDRDPMGRTIGRSTIFGGVAFSPDGAVAAADGYDGVLLVRAGGASTRLTVPESDASVDEVAFSGDGNKLAASSDDGAIHVWDLRRSGPPVQLPPKGALESHELVLDQAGETIADWGLTDPLRLWDVPGRKLVRRWGEDSAIVAAVLVDDGQTLVAAGADGSVEEWDVDRAERRGSIARPGGGGLFGDVSADGRTVAFGDGTGVVRLWDRRSDSAPAPLPGGPRRFPSVALSADGRTLAVSREDGDVQLWDVRARTPLGRPLSGTAYADVAFSGDGSVVATAAVDKLRLWEGILWRDLAHLRAQICGLVGGDLTRAEWTAIAPGLDYPTICSRSG